MKNTPSMTITPRYDIRLQPSIASILTLDIVLV
ncbi:uncharacterized protein METZ01_LOCUS99894 [marine metagenome]|uniref:Uncharacterized protein n=1 Tax=marine metagenome TaxID=408172 RepID=A0A381W3D3_9ZZZZ